SRNPYCSARRRCGAAARSRRRHRARPAPARKRAGRHWRRPALARGRARARSGRRPARPAGRANGRARPSGPGPDRAGQGRPGLRSFRGSVAVGRQGTLRRPARTANGCRQRGARAAFRLPERRERLDRAGRRGSAVNRLPASIREDFARARRLEWQTLFWMSTVVAAMFFTMGGSQAMRSALIEDVLSLVPAVTFLIAARFEPQDPTEKYPFGFVRVNSLAFLVAAVALTAVGGFLMCESAMTLIMAEHPTVAPVEVFGHTV